MVKGTAGGRNKVMQGWVILSGRTGEFSQQLPLKGQIKFKPGNLTLTIFCATWVLLTLYLGFKCPLLHSTCTYNIEEEREMKKWQLSGEQYHFNCKIAECWLHSLFKEYANYIKLHAYLNLNPLWPSYTTFHTPGIKPRAGVCVCVWTFSQQVFI